MRHTIQDLRAELRKLRYVEASDAFQQALKASPSVSSFMKVLPTEIRLKIYKFLLFNPQLSQALWIGKNTMYGATFRYELSPNILRVCRSISEEARDILYGLNTFIFVCHRRHEKLVTWLPQCPLTRYLDPVIFPRLNPIHSSYILDFDKIVNLKAVKRWHILSASTQAAQSNDGLSRNLTKFCQKICLSSLKSLSITWVASKKASGQILVCEAELNKVGRLLGLFRNVETATFNVAQRKDVPDGFHSSTSNWYPITPEEISTTTRDRAKAIARGSSAVERLFQMNALLLTYAQTFERNEQFKAQMDPVFRLPVVQDHKHQPQIRRNPYQDDGLHLIERNLFTASRHGESQNSSEFKKARKIIVWTTLIDIIDAFQALYSSLKDTSRNRKLASAFLIPTS